MHTVRAGSISASRTKIKYTANVECYTATQQHSKQIGKERGTKIKEKNNSNKQEYTIFKSIGNITNYIYIVICCLVLSWLLFFVFSTFFWLFSRFFFFFLFLSLSGVEVYNSRQIITLDHVQNVIDDVDICWYPMMILKTFGKQKGRDSFGFFFPFFLFLLFRPPSEMDSSNNHNNNIKKRQNQH